MNWINVEDKHFVDITRKCNGYSWTGEIDKIFLVAVPLKNGWCIEKVILSDVIGLEVLVDEETFPFPYDMTDITHYIEIESPKIK